MAMEKFTNSATTTVAAGLNNTTDPVTFSVVSAAAFPSSGNFHIRVGNEILLVTVVSGVNFTVSRAKDGTTAESHDAGETVTEILTADSLDIAMMDRLSLPMDFRLSLESNVPVSTADQVGKTTLYCTPYIGTRIGLYDGVNRWLPYQSSQFSLELGTLTSGLPYDVFCYAAGSPLIPTLEILAWTSTSARQTALAYQDGRLVKSGTPSRLYIGTFYTTATTTTEDSIANRFLWNYYNRVQRACIKDDSTSHTYNSATIRYFNNDTTNFCAFVLGVVEESIMVTSTSIWLRQLRQR